MCYCVLIMHNRKQGNRFGVSRRLLIPYAVFVAAMGCLPAVAGTLVPAPADLYGRAIVVESNASSDLRALAGSLVTNLEDMTGVEFGLITNGAAADGIFLLRAAPDLAVRYPALGARQTKLDDLSAKGLEAVYQFSPGSNGLYIVGNSDAALSLGMYDCLHQLGWRALLPGSNWTIRPPRSSILLNVNAIREPAFRQRSFFGTGGFGGALPLDPGRRVEADWGLWKEANRFGGAIEIGGHAGEAFNTRYATILQTNAAMRAYDVYPGSHVPYSMTMKPDAADPGLQALYVNDRVAAHNPAAYAVSVEPADGGGFCVCPACTEFDPVSSQVFGLARRVADAMNAVHPGARVSLFAYNAHAGVPADPALRAWLADPAANVYVNVIPYAFQRTGLDGDQLAAAWAAAKPLNRGIYDYWSIPDWANNLPNENFERDVRKLQYWASLGYDGLHAESTTSGGAVGLLWYMAGRLMVEPDQGPEALREEFYRLAFGPAAPPLKRMLERWGRGFTLVEQEVGLSFSDVAEARRMAAGDAGSLARVNDYAAYVQYIRLYLEYQKTAAGQAIGTPERHAAADALLQFVWQIHSNDMVHAYRMNELVRNRYESTDTALQADWSPANAAAAGWARVRANPFTDAQLAASLEEGLASYAAAPQHALFEQPAFSTNLVALDPDYTLDGQLTARAANLYGGATFAFYVKPGVESLSFQFTPGGLGTADLTDTLWVYDPGGAVVCSNTFGGNGAYGQNGTTVTFTVATATSGNYSIYVYDPKKSFTLAAERNLPFVLTSPLTSTYQINQTAYFYVPSGVPVAALYAPGALPVLVRDGAGNTVAPCYGDGIGESDYTVSAGQAGAVWSMGNFKCYAPGAWPLNGPAVWSFSPAGPAHGMMIPVNAAPGVCAGYDALIVAPTNTLGLNGTLTDDHLSPGPYVTSLWSKASGPGPVAFADAADPQTTAAFTEPGVYSLRLTVTDTGNLSAWDEVTVEYRSTPPNLPPVVLAGTNLTISLPAAAELNGSVSDDGLPDPFAVNSVWTEVRGPGTAVFIDPASPGTQVAFDTPGTYLLRLTAGDGGLTAFDEVNVTVLPDYTAPVWRDGDTGSFGTPLGFDYNNYGQTFDSTGKQYSARFRALETATVDRVYQRYIGVDSNTTVQIGIMGDNGTGNPSGVFLASTAPDFHPAEGMAWAVFTNPATLAVQELYHVVTRVTALGPAESFSVRRSNGDLAIRPFDRANDPFMSGMTSSDTGATWSVLAADPYFTLGNGSGVVAGPGNAEQTASANGLLTQGGTGKAAGQRFVISPREAPTNTLVLIGGLVLPVQNVNAAHDLIVKLRQGDGTVLGTIVRPAAAIASTMTDYAWSFDNVAQIGLTPGRTYYLTTELGAGSGAGEYYYFKAIYGDVNTRGNTWGGTNECVPVQSAAGNSWNGFNWASPAPYGGRDAHDLCFALSGRVTDLNGPYDTMGDGIPDAWRRRFFGGDGFVTNSATSVDGDYDGDGFPNGNEYRAGTDPTNPASLFRIESVAVEPDAVRLVWQIGGGRTAVVQSAASLAGGFTNCSPAIVAPGSGDVFSEYIDEAFPVGVPSRFYRIRLVP